MINAYSEFSRRTPWMKFIPNIIEKMFGWDEKTHCIDTEV